MCAFVCRPTTWRGFTAEAIADCSARPVVMKPCVGRKRLGSTRVRLAGTRGWITNRRTQRGDAAVRDEGFGHACLRVT